LCSPPFLKRRALERRTKFATIQVCTVAARTAVVVDPFPTLHLARSKARSGTRFKKSLRLPVRTDAQTGERQGGHRQLSQSEQAVLYDHAGQVCRLRR